MADRKRILTVVALGGLLLGGLALMAFSRRKGGDVEFDDETGDVEFDDETGDVILTDPEGVQPPIAVPEADLWSDAEGLARSMIGDLQHPEWIKLRGYDTKRRVKFMTNLQRNELLKIIGRIGESENWRRGTIETAIRKNRELYHEIIEGSLYQYGQENK